MSRAVVVLPGDGIGPEVMAPAVHLLRELGDFQVEEYVFGGAALELHGNPMSDEVLAACRASDAVLFGAVGGPQWDNDLTLEERPGDALLRLRQELGVYANLRPVRTFGALRGLSPIRPEVLEDTDLLIVRELNGGIYFGARGRRPNGNAFDTAEYSVAEVERVARIAFRTARYKVTNVDKANVLATSRLWRDVIERIHQEEFPEIELEQLYVDNAALQLVTRPADFDVIVTDNMFGDILSDEAAALTGSIGLMPSASLSDGGPGLFEPIHGSAPDIAGKNIASPLAMFLTVAVMLRHGLDMPDEAAALESAISKALDDGLRTFDLGGSHTTTEAGEAVRRALVTV
ncbi:3-isopropylmalate dehydrogenase [Streptomyces sp. NPDC001393]